MKLRIWLLLILPMFLMAHEHIFSLGELGSIRYVSDNGLMRHIDRLSNTGKPLYTHTYHYDEMNRLVSETLIGGLGDIIYESPTIAKSPYHQEICEYDANQNLIRHTQNETVNIYSYNNLNELILEDSPDICEYNLAGDLIRKGDTHYEYDEQHRLLKVTSKECEVIYAYDAEGIRTSKTVNGQTESYLLEGINEMAILDGDGNLKALRIPGISTHIDLIRAIAIETKDAIYAPIHNVQGNIVKLIDVFSREVITLAQSDPFGRGLSDNSPIPWIFSGKHYDPETGLVYFGHRFYCPELKRWLTPDPALQTADLYQYCFNNPFSFFDPDGRFAFAVPLVNFALGFGSVVTSPIWGTGAILVAAGAAVGYAGYKGVQYLNNSWDAKERAEFEQRLADMGIYPDQIEKRSKKGDVDSSLPSNPKELEDKSKWEDVSHPEAKKNGHYKYKDKQTGEIIEYDEGAPGQPGHRGRDHYHRPNPEATGAKDKYLDAKGNPVPDKSESSHLYPPE